MKKIVKIVVSLILMLNASSYLKGQSQNSITNPIKTVEASIGRGGSFPNCREAGLCQPSAALLANASTESINNRTQFFMNNAGNLVLKVYKENLSTELAEDLAFKNMYYLETDTPINENIKQALEIDKPLILARGWHLLIELDDSYVISYTLKQ